MRWISVGASIVFSASFATAGVIPELCRLGQVCVTIGASSSFDGYTRSPSITEQQWMRDHYTRIRAYSPYFDSRLSWYPDAWFYRDLYAVHPDEALADEHPDWILRDGSGNRLFIPYRCGGGTCPQYAADIGNPAFRARWIADARERMAQGYKGIFIDDVNLKMMVSNGDADLVAPWDPRLGRPMTTTDWRRYVADFAEEIRDALPDAEIVHNQVWFFAPLLDFHGVRALLAADIINVERGFNDRGIRGGGGTWGFGTLMTYINTLHFIGRGIVYDINATWGREYGLAMYFLLQGPRDTIGNRNGGRPDDWWSGNDVHLGPPLTREYLWNGVWRRDFTNGLVLVNPPEAPALTLSLPATYRGLDGGLYDGVTLEAADGIVLATP